MKPFFTALFFTALTLPAFSQAWDWTKTGAANERVNSMAIDGQQFFITALGCPRNDPPYSYYGILNKRDRHGNLVWQKRFSRPTSGSFVYNGVAGVVTDQQGNIYTSNNAYDSVNHVYTGRRGTVCKYDFNGNLLWSRELSWFGQSGRGDIVGSAMAKDEQDNIYVTGLAGNTLESYIFAVNNNFVFGSDTVVAPSNGGSYMVVAKFDKNGQPLWLKAIHYICPSSVLHRTAITSIAVKNGQVAIAGTTNLTQIYFDSTLIYGDRGSNFLTMLNANNGSVKWVKNIRFNGFSGACVSSCDAPKARVIFGHNNKLVLASAYSDSLAFGGIKYSANRKRQYYIAQYDTSGAEEMIKILPNDTQGSGLQGQILPSYQDVNITKNNNQYYLHVLNHLYKMDSAYQILWTSTNTAWSQYDDFFHHTALTADPSGRIIGQGTNFNDTTTRAGNETIYNPASPNTRGYYSRINDAYNIISGYLFYDLNGNGTKDTGEPSLKNHPVVAMPGNRFVGISDTAGFYQCLSDTGTFTYRPANMPLYHAAAPAAGHTITTNTFNITIANKNFAFTPIPGITDVAVDLMALSATRPGFMGRLRMVVSNKGTATQTGTATLRLPSQFSFVSAQPTPVSATADSVVFGYSNLQPGASKYYDVDFRVSASVIFGTQLFSVATVYPLAIDTVKANNRDTLDHSITGSFDPNDKAVNLDGNVSIDKKNEALEYTIRFQNTGNDTAFNIRIVDTLSAKLNPGSFELVSSTHPVQAEISQDRILTFYYNNILLVDSVHNEPLSHGAVKFRMKPQANVQLNDSILNSAAIYFDYNAPVITNVTKTKYVGYPTVSLGNDIAICGGSVTLQPVTTGHRFLWSTGDTLPNITVSNSGTYWVRVTNGYGLSASDTVLVTLKPLPTVNLGADRTQCGGTATLDAGNIGSGYLWSNGATTRTITVNASGNYAVKVTNAQGCSQSDTVQVIIHALPTVNLGADRTQCGGTAILDAGNAGNTYLWSNGATTRTITVNASGNYAVKVTNAQGCSQSDTVLVTVHALPIVNLGADRTQCGGTATLDAGNIGSGYLWSNGATTRTITVNASGNYAVKVTNAQGCSQSDTLLVAIHALPIVNLGADRTQCGGTATLDAGNIGSGYLWSNGATTQKIIATTTGSYWVNVTNGMGCSGRDTIQVTIHALPTIQFSLPDTVYANDAPLLLTASPTGGSFTGPATANGRFDAATAGQGRHTLRYSYTSPQGCSATVTASLVVIAPVKTFTVYPNPNKGAFTVVQTHHLLNSTLSIITPTGIVLGNYPLPARLQPLRLLLRPGLYYLQLTAPGFSETKRMLVQ
jgi:uncharacterized repeat protein (TIGR01451 family)